MCGKSMQSGWRVPGWCLVLLATAWPVAASRSEEPTAAPARLEPLPDSIRAPEDNPTTAAKVALGKQLFFDPRLSGDNSMSCATCHLPEKAFADGRARSPGQGGKPLERNTPGLLDVGLHSSFFWDGRASTLEEQALGPIQSPVEMNQSLDELERELGQVPGYVAQFEKIFGRRPHRADVARALAAFQRTLLAPNSPLDRYLAGDRQALSAEARRGLELFRGEAGCIRCHQGPLLSDGKYYRVGISFRDRGRSAVTGKAEDEYRFRTPTLRNIARTAPYMHDGSLETLDDVVTFYLREVPTRTPDGRQLDLEPASGVSFDDLPALVAFLKALTGTAPGVTPPDLPD